MCYIKNSNLDKLGNIVKVAVWSKENKTWSGVSTANRGRDGGIRNGTFQIVEETDIVLISMYPPEDTFNNTPIVVARQVVGIKDNNDTTVDNLVTIAPGNNVNVGAVFQNVTNNLWLWLLNLTEEADGFLPAGIGWDGDYTLYDQRKRDRIRSMLYGVTDEVLTSTILEAGQISSGSETPTNWADAMGLPHTEPCKLEWEINNNTTKMVYAIEWFKDNRVNCTKITEGFEDNNYFEVDPDATKVLIGTINIGNDKKKYLTRWKIYSR